MGNSFHEKETWSDIPSLNRRNSFDDKRSLKEKPGSCESKSMPPDWPGIPKVVNGKMERLTLEEYFKILDDEHKQYFFMGETYEAVRETYKAQKIQQYCIDSTPKWRANETNAIANDAKYIQTEPAELFDYLIPYCEWKQSMRRPVEKGQKSKDVFIMDDSNGQSSVSLKYVTCADALTVRAEDKDVQDKKKKRDLLKRILCFM